MGIKRQHRANSKLNSTLRMIYTILFCYCHHLVLKIILSKWLPSARYTLQKPQPAYVCWERKRLTYTQTRRESCAYISFCVCVCACVCVIYSFSLISYLYIFFLDIISINIFHLYPILIWHDNYRWQKQNRQIAWKLWS